MNAALPKIIAIFVVSATAIGGALVYRSLILSPSVAERFVASVRALEESDIEISTGEATNEASDDELSEAWKTGPFEQMGVQLLNQHREPFLEILKAYEFKDAEEWAAVGDRLVRVLVLKDNPSTYNDLQEDLQEDLRAQLRSIDSMVDLTDKERNEARRRLEANISEIDRLRPTAEEINAVERYLKEFSELLAKE